MIWAVFSVIISTVHLTVSSYHVTYAFQSESTRYNFLNVKELLAWNRRDIWKLSDCNGTRMHRTDKYSQHSLIIWLVWLNGWVLVYELSGCEFESRCCHLNFRCHACFEQGVPWHSDNYRVLIHFEMRTWNNKNVQASEYITTFIKSLWKRDLRANAKLFWTFFQCGFRKAHSR